MVYQAAEMCIACNSNVNLHCIWDNMRHLFSFEQGQLAIICCSCARVWWCQGCEEAKPTETSEGCWGWVGHRAECLTHDVVCGAGPPLVGHSQTLPPSLPLHAPWNYTPVFFHPSQHEESLVECGADSGESRFGLLYYNVEIVTSVEECTAGPVMRWNRSKLGV